MSDAPKLELLPDGAPDQGTMLKLLHLAGGITGKDSAAAKKIPVVNALAERLAREMFDDDRYALLQVMETQILNRGGHARPYAGVQEFLDEVELLYRLIAPGSTSGER